MERLTLPLPASANRDVYSVSRLNREIRGLLEASLPTLWVEGEISNLAQPGSGHLYFCLKDAQAQVRCALFRTSARGLACAPRNGMRVLARACVSLYETRGEFQLIVDYLEEAGEGALRRAFEALKAKLAAEGLFEAARKRPLPAFPRRVGVVTSASGAAVRDVITTLKRRFPAIAVLVYPVPVQGDGAGARVASAIARASERAECEVLIVARGGGSLEDLQAFNDESVARALAACRIPTVTGIGHEIDFTIADFVADVRAPTPTAAAEIVSPDAAALGALLSHFEARLAQGIRRRLRGAIQRVDHARARLVSPQERLRDMARRAVALERRLRLAHDAAVARARHALMQANARLRAHVPSARIEALWLRARHAHARLVATARAGLARRVARAGSAAQRLDALSPLATLARGYAITRGPDGAIVRDARRLRVGDPLQIQFAHGGASCRVDEIEE